MATYTGSVTLTNINDGADADSYHLSSNIEGFQKHYEYDQAGNEVIIFSDKVIEFQLEHNINGQFQPISPSSYDTSLLTLENEEFDIVGISDISDLWGLFQRINVVNYIQLQSKPSNWTTNYNEYYRLISNQYVLITDEEPPEWEDDWLTNPELIPFYQLDSQNTTLYNKIYSIDTQNNSIIFNLYNSTFYPVDETLNLVDGQPSNYLLALKSYRNFVLSHNAYFILNAFEDSNLSELYDYKIFFVEYVVNLDFARFALTATNIQASVDNSALIFDGTGLTIYDGGLTIKQSEQYAQTEDSAPEQGKTYFVYENKQYIEYTGNFNDGFALSQSRPDDWDEIYTSYYTYNPGADPPYVSVEPSDPVPTWQANTYYRPVYEIIPASDLLKYDIENKRLNIKGSGEFTGTIYATDGVFSGTIAALAGSIGGFTINNDALVSEVTENDVPLIQLLGSKGRIIAKNINLGTGVVIEDYIKLGNSYIYNPLTNDNSFIDIKDANDESIVEFKADGTGNIGAIHINGNSSRLNGINWWISPDKASFSNIDVTGTIHTSVFETGRIQSVGGSMIFKEGAKVQSIENTTEGLILTLETKMSLKPGSIVLCTTNDSDYTDTTLTNQENFYGKVISSVIPREYVKNTQPFFENVTYYTKNENDQYTRFTGNSFEDGKTYYLLVEGDQQVIVKLEPDAIGYENLINQIIQLGDNNFSPTEDRSRYSEWDYNHSTETPEEWNNIYNTLYIKSDDVYILLTKKPSDWEENYYKYYIQENNNYELIGSNEGRIDYGTIDQAIILVNSTAPNFVLNTYYAKTSTFIKNEDSNYDSQETYYINNNKDYYTYETLTDSLLLYTGNDLVQGTIYFERESTYTNNLIIGVNASEHINKMLYPEGFTFIKFDGLVDNISPTYNSTPILFLGNLDGLNDENISGYGLYGENVFLTGSLTTRYASTENFKYAGVNTLTGAIATIFEKENYFSGELLPENDKIIFWAGSESTAAEDIQTSPLQITEHGYFYASHGVFEGSIFVKATIEASELRTASIYGTGNAPALKIYNTSIEKLGIHFYEHNGELEHETLRLTSAGFSNDQGNSQFIEIDEFNKVNFNGNNITGNVFYTIPVNSSQLEIIGTNFNIYQYNQEGSANIYRFINFNPDNQFYEIKYDDANRILQDKQNGELTLFSGSTKVSTNLSLGGKIDYKQAIEEREEGNQTISELIGYDLFVR